MNLLAKARNINDLIKKNINHQDIFIEMSELLSELTQSNVYMISSQDTLLGYNIKQPIAHDWMQQGLENHPSPETSVHHLFSLHEVFAGQNSNREDLTIPVNDKDLFERSKLTAVVSIIGGRECFGTIVMNRLHEPFCEDDIVLAEYVATLLGLKLRRRKAKGQEKEARSMMKAQKVIHTLTHSELAAVGIVLQELNGKAGLIVTSKVAKKYSISRSILIVALRKLKTAGIIESHSLGVKGTYIKILNEKILEAVTVTHRDLSNEYA
ncbi:GTP-sensing pleiotropic transcriptional regulator CodY [Bacillus benzoevorans]|uniref:Global transcriptional regulator CodY n=1 Tax=Bacillus benzoevorans TaxID=1456 RepID=A0A7X0LWL9_9BACI|nr:GTP-sensing pleiotropic transcriptional regulator CodY [Bacillus benzoevorans]MBB6446863.1 transcriptional pleiotropic repressor [Bacillus benzoevorans]